MPRSLNTALVLALAIAATCSAREAVYLKTGFSLEADSHTQQNQTLVFRIGTGTLEFAASDVDRIEMIPDAGSARPAVAPSPECRKPEDILNRAAESQGLDQEFVRSVAKIESGLRQEAISRKGAVGLMQLMPATAAELGIRADQAADNARGGATYLRDLLIRYHANSALALAAYNAGPGAVAKFGGVPPYPETQRYVLLVLREYERQKAKAKTASLAAAANTTSATK